MWDTCFVAARHPGERTREQVAVASLPEPVEREADGEHVHEPFLFGWDTNAKGEMVEIWRCLSDFQVSETVPNPNLDPDHPDHAKEFSGEGPDEVAGRTIYPGDPDHPYGQPCGLIVEVVHDPELWTNDKTKGKTQQQLYRANAPDQFKEKK